MRLDTMHYALYLHLAHALAYALCTMYYALCTALAPCTCTRHYALCTVLAPCSFCPQPIPDLCGVDGTEKRGSERGGGEEMSRRASYVQYKRGQKLVPSLYFTNMSFLEMQVPPLGKYIHLKLSLAQMIKSTGTRPKCPHNSSSSTSNNSSNSSNGSNVLRELSSRLVLPPPLSTSYYSLPLLSARLVVPRTARSILASIQEVAATHRAKPRVPAPRRTRTNVKRAW